MDSIKSICILMFVTNIRIVTTNIQSSAVRCINEITVIGKINVQLSGAEAFKFIYFNIDNLVTDKKPIKTLLCKYVSDMYDDVKAILHKVKLLSPLEWCSHEMPRTKSIQTRCQELFKNSVYKVTHDPMTAFYHGYHDTKLNSKNMTKFAKSYHEYILQKILPHLNDLNTKSPISYCTAYNVDQCLFTFIHGNQFKIGDNGKDIFLHAYMKLTLYNYVHQEQEYIRMYHIYVCNKVASAYDWVKLLSPVDWCKHQIKEKVFDNELKCYAHFNYVHYDMNKNGTTALKHACFYIIDRSSMHDTAREYFMYLIDEVINVFDPKIIKEPLDYCKSLKLPNALMVKSTSTDNQSNDVPSTQLSIDQQQSGTHNSDAQDQNSHLNFNTSAGAHNTLTTDQSNTDTNQTDNYTAHDNNPNLNINSTQWSTFAGDHTSVSTDQFGNAMNELGADAFNVFDQNSNLNFDPSMWSTFAGDTSVNTDQFGNAMNELGTDVFNTLDENSNLNFDSSMWSTYAGGHNPVVSDQTDYTALYNSSQYSNFKSPQGFSFDGSSNPVITDQLGNTLNQLDNTIPYDHDYSIENNRNAYFNYDQQSLSTFPGDNNPIITDQPGTSLNQLDYPVSYDPNYSVAHDPNMYPNRNQPPWSSFPTGHNTVMTDQFGTGLNQFGQINSENINQFNSQFYQPDVQDSQQYLNAPGSSFTPSTFVTDHNQDYFNDSVYKPPGFY